MDKTTKKITDDAQHAVYMCNLLIEQCAGWAKPPTVEEYMALKKKKEASGKP